MEQHDLLQKTLNTIRFLAVDAVEKAKSGHPGTPMGSTEIAYTLWMRHMKYNPSDPKWVNRDRFVLSAGHASMLLYSMLYLTGYDLTLDDIKQFRQLDSRTPGHPEYGCTPGVETTTGPLGQGIATSIGMMIGERYLGAWFNRPGYDLIDYHTYVFCSDGDMMEGISSEAASLAGHLGLSKLICIYSDNRISIEGSTDLAFTEDVGKRFEAYEWYVQDIDGHDMVAIDEAITNAKSQSDKPSMIHAHCHIGYGSPDKQDSADAHGEPLGVEETIRAKTNLGWPTEPAFLVPDDVLNHMRTKIDEGKTLEDKWNKQFQLYAEQYPELADVWTKSMAGELPDGWEDLIPQIGKPGEEIATRDASGKVMNAIAPALPFFIGGSGDLSPSTKTHLNAYSDFTATEAGRNLRFGVREHTMGACLSGLALTPPLMPFGSTFLVFSDYMRPAIRLASIMKLRVTYFFTHDSFCVGEDGPTHEPIEHLAALRAIPNLTVIRPADVAETVAAWKYTIKHSEGPVALILSRQKLPVLERTETSQADLLEKGAYILHQIVPGRPDIILIATGSEVSLAVSSAKVLEADGLNVRVVSLPSWELFDIQSKEYRDTVLPPSVTARMSIEAGVSQGWEKYIGCSGSIIAMRSYGESAPYKALLERFGFTTENVVTKAKELLNN